MNPNVEIPQPKTIEIKKLAIFLEDYDELRKYGQRAEDLSQPADPIMIETAAELDIEATNYLMNEGYKSRNMVAKPKKKRRAIGGIGNVLEPLSLNV